jgi:hypothetical protein
MGRPQHDIDQIWILSDDLGQRLDHVLDTLARGEQSEGQQHLLVLDSELILEIVRIDEGVSGMPCARSDRSWREAP